MKNSTILGKKRPDVQNYLVALFGTESLFGLFYLMLVTISTNGTVQTEVGFLG